MKILNTQLTKLATKLNAIKANQIRVNPLRLDDFFQGLANVLYRSKMIDLIYCEGKLVICPNWGGELNLPELFSEITLLENTIKKI